MALCVGAQNTGYSRSDYVGGLHVDYGICIQTCLNVESGVQLSLRVCAPGVLVMRLYEKSKNGLGEKLKNHDQQTIFAR